MFAGIVRRGAGIGTGCLAGGRAQQGHGLVSRRLNRRERLEMATLLGPADVPPGFDYPREFIRVVELGLMDLEPWRLLDGEDLFSRHLGMRGRYPARSLVPFARRTDSDDVACWDLDRDGRVVVVDDFEPAGWEHVSEFASFYAWLRRAIEDLIEFDD
jgi:hypothetical protein